MSSFSRRDKNIGSYYLPPFCSKISSTTYELFNFFNRIFKKYSDDRSVNNETPYSNKKVLVDNWEEELSDVRNREYWKKRISNYEHCYLTTYGCSYNRYGIIIPPKFNDKEPRCLPCHQPELDPDYMKSPKFYQSITQTSYSDPHPKKIQKNLIPEIQKTKEAATQTYPQEESIQEFHNF
ncbi:UPF0686 protein C11orf1 homolog [Centruroides sculpturatus]|uniref:UPF0686 protein C11orf1 homolog n=1 Tax=Centruroides sculpturatus TaxID=218467 RepID=UPI000C6CD124|nr:UPF0686 protein C11orf1 homolog [Centruroides sculpturatus]